jgi:cyanophycinase
MSEAPETVPLFALVGGEEFQPPVRPVDEMLVERLGRAGVEVAILPTAAARERPELAAANGVRHFQGLGVRARALMVVDRPSADDPRLVEQLEGVNLVYLAGGDPQYLLETLRGCRVWERIAAMAAAGCVVAGSSAGAMVLGETMYYRGDWQPALALVPGICVLPHFEKWGMEALPGLRESPASVGLTLLGIDGATGCVGAGREWTVAGRGSVTVARPERVEVFKSGQRLSL